ncbi:MAG: hypothetical protein KME59_19610 [Trichormus sp. ATA11-4-KO1]|jgi:hypothetical protein|nr:hypothetical protein [Trichormus sp. ATA11-4-KO1]
MLAFSKKNYSAKNSTQKMPRCQSLLQTMFVIPTLVVSMIAATHKPALSAQTCPYQVHNTASSYATKIVTQEKNLYFLLPMGLRTRVEECTYFANEGAFIAYMRMDWQHPWEENKPYVAVVRVEANPRYWNWQLKNFNANLGQHLLTVGFIKTLSQ